MITMWFSIFERDEYAEKKLIGIKMYDISFTQKLSLENKNKK